MLYRSMLMCAMAFSCINAEPLSVRAQLIPLYSTVLASEVAGKISQFPLREGVSFNKGDMLVVLDCALHQARLNRANAQIQEAQKTYEAHQKLDQLGSISGLEKDVSHARLLMAKADASLAQAMVERCVIKAPFSGRVVERKVNRYEYVAEGTPLIEIIDDKNLEVEMILPSSSLVWLKIGHPFSLHVEELGKIFQGKIERIVSKVDPVSQSLQLYGSIDVNVEHLYPGMSGTIKIQP